MFELSFLDLELGKAFSNDKAPLELIAILSSYLKEGHLCLPLKTLESTKRTYVENLISQCPSSMISFSDSQKATPIYFLNECVYLHKAFRYETLFFEEITRFLNTLSKLEDLPFDLDQTLAKKQNEALQKALAKGMLILTGGPGTGKTFTAKKIALELIKKSPFFKKTLILAAPTSKALSQLKKSLGTIPDDVEMIADTLHKLVEFKSKKPAYLNASCIIVDEASMIEAPLFAKFFSCLGSQAKLILMGDPFQLPPVGLGSLFQDLIDLKHYFPNIQHVHLDEPQRCHNHNLLELYEIIQKGSFEDFYKKIDTSSNDIQVIKKPLQNLSYETLQELISFFKDEHFYYDDFYEITFKIDSIILSTLRRGLLGVDMINKELSTYFINKNLNKRFYIEPIMMIESFKEQNLFNGETGFKIYDRHKEITFFQFDKKTLPYLNESSYTQAFALSVHKSQGSEYQRVLFMIPQGSERFSLEIIYTAITRVKQTLFMWFDKEPLKEAFSKRNLRYSGLRHRCKN